MYLRGAHPSAIAPSRSGGTPPCPTRLCRHRPDRRVRVRSAASFTLKVGDLLVDSQGFTETQSYAHSDSETACSMAYDIDSSLIACTCTQSYCLAKE